MPSRIPLPAFCCFLLPWAFTSFHKALGNPATKYAGAKWSPVSCGKR
uniref:Hyaluronan and proteoglycan link protein 2 n=1 Tax=Mus musculus TaxID=10090 RepID=E0CXI3_MOUSE